MEESRTFLDAMRRYLPLMGYIFLTILAVGAFVRAELVAERLEQESAVRTYSVCQAVNESRAVLRSVLELLARERDDDEPGEFERRQRLLERTLPLIPEIDCPPPPPTR